MDGAAIQIQAMSVLLKGRQTLSTGRRAVESEPVGIWRDETQCADKDLILVGTHTRKGEADKTPNRHLYHYGFRRRTTQCLRPDPKDSGRLGPR